MIAKRSLALILALVTVVGGIIGEAAAKDTKEVREAFAGTFLSTRMDVFPLGNPDGAAAGWATSKNDGDLGESDVQAIVERVPTGPTRACPGGVAIIDRQNGVGFGVFTQTFPNAEDQIYYEIHTSTLCADEGVGFTAENAGIIVGGTGKFVGVSGTFKNRAVGVIQYGDAASVPSQAFGSFSGESKIELSFP